MLQVGDEAPQFEADSTQGQVRLRDWLGSKPIVLIFYPMDDTPGCTAQLCAVRDSKRQYEALGAVVLGVNPASMDRHRQFADKHGYDFPIVYDQGERIRKQYKVGKILGLLAQQRIVYVIGRDGRIAFSAKGTPSTETLLQVVKDAAR